jgi:hypothetical protein
MGVAPRRRVRRQAVGGVRAVGAPPAENAGLEAAPGTAQ